MSKKSFLLFLKKTRSTEMLFFRGREKSPAFISLRLLVARAAVTPMRNNMRGACGRIFVVRECTARTPRCAKQASWSACIVPKESSPCHLINTLQNAASGASSQKQLHNAASAPYAPTQCFSDSSTSSRTLSLIKQMRRSTTSAHTLHIRNNATTYP